MAGRRHVPMATTDTIHTLARPMAITVRVGSQVECSLAPGRGMAGAGDGAAAWDMVAGAGDMVVAAGATVTESLAPGDMREVRRG